MNDQTDRQLNSPSRAEGDPAANRPDGFGDAPRFTVDKDAGKKAGKKNEAVLGPFTVRDLTVFGSTFLLFVASLIPMFAGGYNLWNLGSLFFLGLGIVLPLIVSGLFAARRVTPETRIRFGSLSMDQFASVVASFALAFFFLSVAGAFVPSMLVGLIGAIGLFAATVLGRWIPFFAGDFAGRAEVPAHVVAREAAVPVRAPRAPKEPKEPKESKDSGAGKVAGWAHRVMPGSHGAKSHDEPAHDEPSHDAAPRDEKRTESTPGASASAAAGAAGAGAAAAGAAGAGAASAGAGREPASGQPETRVSAAVPPSSGSSRPAAPSPSAGPKEPATQAGPAVQSSKSQQPAGPAGSGPADPEKTQAAPVANAPTTVNPQVRPQPRQAEQIGATVDPASRPDEDAAEPSHEAFWFAVAQPRTAVDEKTGAPAFDIEPGSWVLALKDRGTEFLVQNTDGRLGVLRDLSNIERG